MASGGGFYRRDASLTRQLQSSFSDSQATQSSCPPRQFDTPGPSQFQQFVELSSRMDEMMKMISDTQEIAFNNQAAQTILEEKLDTLMKAKKTVLTLQRVEIQSYAKYHLSSR